MRGMRADFKPLDDTHHVFVGVCCSVDDEQNGVGIFDDAPCRVDHRAVEAALGAEDAGRIDENDLALAFDRDTADRCAGRLHLVRDDGDFGADKRIDERRLAGVRRPREW